MTSNGSTATSGIAPALRGGAMSMTLVLVLALCAPMHAAAQVSVGGSAEASGDADIESGANSASDIERGGSARSNVDDDNDGRIDEGEDRDDDVDENDGRAGGEGLRLGIQGRLDAINMVAIADPDPFLSQRRLLVPIVTPGVRLLDDNELFLGLGLGFSGYSSDNGPNEQSRSGWSLSPLASFDVLKDDVAALALLGWINLASLGEEENCDAGGCETDNDDAFGWGLSLGAGLRGFVSEGLALGGEFGWGFLDIGYDGGGPDVFVHGIFGNIFLEASIGLD
jgi:hypothetical protein